MPHNPPSWWYGRHVPLAAWLLWPVAKVYGTIAQNRFHRAKPYRSSLPVFCVGNFTMGGAGKTPVALTLAKILKEAGFRPGFLTRGYGGQIRGPHVVDVQTDTCLQIGDEPLLLARSAPTMVARDRALGAKALEKLPVDAIIMDDGFQNPSLYKDVSLIVVDGGVGLGVAQVFPLGPLRAPLDFQLSMARIAIIIGGDAASRDLLAPFQNYLKLQATLVPDPDISLKGRRVFAYCGIGRPSKFLTTLQESGADIAGQRVFPDHHVFSEGEALELLRLAGQHNATLITTEKDYVRLRGHEGPLARLREASLALPVSLHFRDDDAQDLRQLIADVMGQYQAT